MKHGIVPACLMLLLIAACFSCGCSSGSRNEPGPSPLPQTTITEATATPLPATETLPVPVAVANLTPAITASPPPAAAATVKETIFVRPGYAASPSDPLVRSLALDKNTHDFTMSDCMMKEAFPEIGNDPGYGIRAGFPPKIRALSPHEMNVFLRDYTEGKNEVVRTIGFTRCTGVAVDPTWNFVTIRGEILPRNAKPSVYRISVYAKALDKDVLVSQSNETLRLEQPVLFELYIPLRTNEIDFFDNPEIQFTRLTNA